MNMFSLFLEITKKRGMATNGFSSLIFYICGNVLQAYCWARTCERQASRMRVIYLKAVLRQDVG